jgi:hypothetical protein
LPELGWLAAAGMPEQARGEDVQREGQVALAGQGGSGGDEGVRLSPGEQVEGRRCFFGAARRIGENMPLPNILDLGYLPALLRDHPAAVVPYLVSRDDFVTRLYHQRTGYWQPDGQGLDRPARTRAAR